MTAPTLRRWVSVTEHYEAPMDAPGERLPLLTRGEAETLIALLGHLADGADEDLRVAALELQARIGMRLPAE